MEITWNTDINAPGSPGVIVAEDGRRVLVQTDFDFPGTARSFGWDMRGENCDHDSTDGTVDCRECGATADEFIEAAGNFLYEADGATVEDPGYFTG